MSYDYIKRSYAFQPEIGRRVRHTVTKGEGVIARESLSSGHYVQVRFDGQRHRSCCHPGELEYIDGALAAEPKDGTP